MESQTIQIDGEQEYQEGLVSSARIRERVRERRRLLAQGQTTGILSDSEIADLVLKERETARENQIQCDEV